jgi:hypothetical protein
VLEVEDALSAPLVIADALQEARNAIAYGIPSAARSAAHIGDFYLQATQAGRTHDEAG